MIVVLFWAFEFFLFGNCVIFSFQKAGNFKFVFRVILLRITDKLPGMSKIQMNNITPQHLFELFIG